MSTVMQSDGEAVNSNELYWNSMDRFSIAVEWHGEEMCWKSKVEQVKAWEWIGPALRGIAGE